MKVDKVLFAAVLLLSAVVATIALAPSTGVGGMAHTDYSTMRHSSVGQGGAQENLWMGWLFGVAIFVTFSSLMAFGAHHRIRQLGPWLVVTTLAVISFWSWLVYSYHSYLSDPAPELYLALPAPTAIMTYLFWPLTSIFVLFFVLGFRQWVLSDDDFETYRRLLDSVRTQDES